MESSIFNNTNQNSDADISDLLNQIRVLQSVDKSSKGKSSISQSEITEEIEQQETSIQNNDEINLWGDVDYFFEQSNDTNQSPPSTSSKKEHNTLTNDVVTTIDDNLSDETAKIADLILLIPDNPPFTCYLHGLSEDISIMDIGMAFMGLNVKFTEIKMPSEENNLVGSIVFRERSGLVTVIEQQSIEINNINVTLSLSMEATTIVDATKIILVDENENKNIESDVINEKPKEEEPIESIHPIQDYIEPSTISLYPPYSLYLFNLPKDTTNDEITNLFAPFDLAKISLSQNTDSTFDGYIEFKCRTNLNSVIMDNCSKDNENMLKIRDYRVILSLKKDYTLKYEKSDKISNILNSSVVAADVSSEIPISLVKQFNDSSFVKSNQLNDTNDASTNSTDSTEIIISDKNVNTNLQINLVDEKTKETASMELVQPLQYPINISKVSLYPPYLCYLFNLPNNTTTEEIHELFDKYNLVSIRLPNKMDSPIVGHIEFKSRTDLISIIHDCQTDDHEKMFKIRNHRIIISLSGDNTLNYDESDKLPLLSSSTTSSSNTNLTKSLISTLLPVTTTSMATAVALPINEQQIPFNPPFLLYLFNISPDISEEKAVELIANLFKISNYDVTNIQKYNENSYSVEFKKRSDLVLAIRKLNFSIDGKEILISISPKIISISPGSMVSAKEKLCEMPINHNNRIQSQQIQPNQQLIQNQQRNHQPGNQQQNRQPHNQQQNRQPHNQQQNRQQGNQQVMKYPQKPINYSTFKLTILLPNSHPNINWFKIVDFPSIATANNLIDFLSLYMISLSRIIITNDGTCFCQFPTENEVKRFAAILLTTPLLLFGTAILIMRVSIQEAQQIFILLVRHQNEQQHNKPLVQNNLSQSTNHLNLKPVEPKVKDNDPPTDQRMSSVNKTTISLAEQLAKLSGETIDNKKSNQSTEQWKEPPMKVNTFQGSSEMTNLQDNTVEKRKDNPRNNNNNNGRRRGGRNNNRNNDRSPRRRDSSQDTCDSRVSRVSNAPNTSRFQRRRRFNHQNPWSNKLSPKLQYECIKCKKVSNLTCSNCGMFYCSLECQKNDWSTHKNNCQIPELISSTEFYEKMQNKRGIEVKQTNNIPRDQETKTIKSTKEIKNQPNLMVNEKQKDNVKLVKRNIVPLKAITIPSFATLKETVVQPKSTEIPLKETVVPLKSTAIPLKETVLPLKETVFPIKETVLPLKETIETPMVRGQINVPYCDIPKPGDSVYITAILDGITVFIRSADPEHDTQYTNNLSEIAVYGKSRSKLLVENPVLGQVILAPLNDNLQRALVLKQRENLLAVAFIDFGNIEMVKFDDCHDLCGNLQKLKRYVHKCTIDAGSEYRSNEMAKEILESFKEFKLDLLYKMPFINSTLVDLTNPLSGISLKKLIGNIF